MDITIDSNQYKLHIVDYKNYKMYGKRLNNTYICDATFVSNSYEHLSYSLLADEGYLGFFLSDLTNSILYVSIVFDLNCSQIRDKLKDYGSIEDAVELTILCSNMTERIRGLATEFLNIVLSDFIPRYKPSVKHILLYVAQGVLNPGASSFYSKLGFTNIQPNIMEYTYGSKVKGGNKRKYRKQKTRRRKIRRRKTRRVNC